MYLSPKPQLKPSASELTKAHIARFGNPHRCGPLPRLWHRLHYHVPDTYYETLVATLVRKDTAWLDVGCGRGVFPSNPDFAKSLAKQCRVLVGIDPDETLEDNTFVHQRIKSNIEEFRPDMQFDLITLRMVAEHITNPREAVASLARLLAPGGKIVIYTVSLWSPAAIAAWLTPLKVHHAIKSVLWQSKEQDTFPVAYRLNTRKCLRGFFEMHGLREVHFAHLPDCCLFYRFRLLHSIELLLWSTLQTFELTYPESCLLAVFERR